MIKIALLTLVANVFIASVGIADVAHSSGHVKRIYVNSDKVFFRVYGEGDTCLKKKSENRYFYFELMKNTGTEKVEDVNARFWFAQLMTASATLKPIRIRYEKDLCEGTTDNIQVGYIYQTFENPSSN